MVHALPIVSPAKPAVGLAAAVAKLNSEMDKYDMLRGLNFQNIVFSEKDKNKQMGGGFEQKNCSVQTSSRYLWCMLVVSYVWSIPLHAMKERWMWNVIMMDR